MTEQNPSLSKLQDIVSKRKYQSPTTPGQDVGVDKEGRVVVVDVTPAGTVSSSRPVSTVPKDTFATDYYQLSQEQSVVSSKMPSNTYRVDEDGIEGWVFEINTEDPYYEDYTMFLYRYNGSYYAKLVDPNYAGQFGSHACHMFSDGKLCLSSQSDGSYPNMADAYAKAVLWAKGFSIFLRTHTFPFLS